MTDAQEFALRVEQALDVVRDALIRIEERAQQDDDPKWLELSRRFAVLVAPLRDYLTGVQMGRDLPQHLAGRLEPLLAEAATDEQALVEAELSLHVQALGALVQQARTRSP